MTSFFSGEAETNVDGICQKSIDPATFHKKSGAKKVQGDTKVQAKSSRQAAVKTGLIRKPSKRVVASSKALSSGGGPAYPPNAPQKADTYAGGDCAID